MKHRLSFCYSKQQTCGCTNIHWFWLFGHKFEPCWAICAKHIREMVMEARRQTSANPQVPTQEDQ